MQAKMASRSRFLNRLYRGLLAVLIPLFRFVARRFPLRILYAAGWVVMHLFLLLRRKYLRALRSNLAQILGAPPGSARVGRLARRVALNHGRYWIDFFYWSERGSEAARRAITGVENIEAMNACFASGRGCVLLTAHLGNWEMGGLLLGPHARDVAVVYVPDRFEVVEAYRSRYRRLAGLSEIPLAADFFTALPALRLLRSGGVVAVQGDRDFNNSGVPLSFFGRTAYFPRGPAMLSLIARVPILPVFILRGQDLNGAGSGGFRVIFFDPIEPTGDPRDNAAIQATVLKTAAVIEEMVRRHPDQWYCFYPFWDDPTRRGRSQGRPAGDQAGRVAPTAAV